MSISTLDLRSEEARSVRREFSAVEADTLADQDLGAGTAKALSG
jgi:hypothetical protein